MGVSNITAKGRLGRGLIGVLGICLGLAFIEYCNQNGVDQPLFRAIAALPVLIGIVSGAQAPANV
jgi:hypothetical protein